MTTGDLVLLVILALCSYRLTRLVTIDAIFDAPRSWALRRMPRTLGYLAQCPFCAGVYVSAALVVAADLSGMSVPAPLLTFGAVAGGQALLAAIDGWLTD